EQLERLPVGVAGELHIGGVQVARGYLNRPELTAERFIADPFSAEFGGRMYKTGDLARFMPDGNVEFLGRIDNQVKVRGFRIELGEIEAALTEIPEVDQAVVLAREDVPGDKRLVAYLVFMSGSAKEPVELTSTLREELPDYMVPSSFVVMDAMPLSPNGKADRGALPAPDRSRPSLRQRYVAPRDPVESYLAEIWSDVLDIDRVGVNDPFFELGGTSYQAALFINRVMSDLQASIFVVTVFESPTIAEYSKLLLNDYPEEMRSKFGGGESADEGAEKEGDRRLSNECIAEMRGAIPALPSGEAVSATRKKNPPALFILAPPRSGTTLLRIMLAGHPGLFSASELQLLGFNTLLERREAYADKFSLWGEGTLRAIMEVKDCDAEEAKRIMREYEDQGLTSAEFYRVLQDWIAPRMLADKSPSYASDLATLKKAEREFDGALYLHLVRHPCAMVRSFEKYRMNQVLYLHDHRFSCRDLGELIWTISHQNVIEFLAGVPPERQYRMVFEELVVDPEKVMRGMCERLGIEFHPDLLNPYDDTDKKMIDGIYRESTPMGDQRFKLHKKIDPKRADSWVHGSDEERLGDETRRIARILGYEL
ncbi:MAG: sulfotransferase family protein, partial [Planctomycetota bacterium]